MPLTRALLLGLALLFEITWLGCQERNPAFFVLPKTVDGSNDVYFPPSTVDAADTQEIIVDASPEAKTEGSMDVLGVMDVPGFLDVAHRVDTARLVADVPLPVADAAQDTAAIGKLDAPLDASMATVDAAMKDLQPDHFNTPLDTFPQPGNLCDEHESCNGIDDNCNSIVDEDMPTSLTCGLGIQEQTVPLCTAGRLNPCKSGSPSINVADGCPADGKDNDSDGMIDEDCVADCVWVWPARNFGPGNGTSQSPYNNLQMAITDAADNAVGKRRVCILAGTNYVDGTNCLETIYPLTGDLEIPDGVSIYGNYKSLDGIACTSQKTKFQLASHQGVVFSGNGLDGAVLARIMLLRQTLSSPTTATTAAVTISGTRRVTLTRLTIDDSPTHPRTIGVHVTNAGSDVLITRSHIEGGLGQTAIGVLVEAGKVSLQSNCDVIDSFGNCTTACNSASMDYGIFGRQASNPSGWANITSFGLLVEKSAHTTIEANSICGVASNQPQTNTTAVALHCGPGSCAHIGKNHITGGFARQATGLSLNLTATAVDSNFISGGCGIAKTESVVLDATNARLQNNVILGGICVANQEGLFRGLVVIAGDHGQGPDIHSNTIEVGTVMGNCQGYGIVLTRTSGTIENSSGLFRNNIIGMGECLTNVGLFAQASVLPIALHHNLFHPGSGFETVFFKYNQEAYKTIEGVNSWNRFAKANVWGHPGYIGYPTNFKLFGDSPCINLGIDEGAPLYDVNLVSRPKDGKFDIGAHE